MPAPKVQIHRITNANIYMADNNLLGRASEIKLPDIQAIMTEQPMLGMFGKIELPTGGIDKLEGELKWNSFYPDVWGTVLNPFDFVALQCRSAIDVYGNTGLKEQKSLVTHLSVIFKKNPMGTYKQNENAEFSSEFEALSIRQLVDGKEVTNLDFLSNIFEVNGKDLLSNYREIIGG